MCGLMGDLISGKTAPAVANAVCNAGGKLLKVVELENKYGNYNQHGSKTLALSASA